MSFTKRNLLVSGLTLAALLGAGVVMAQEGNKCHCAFPVNFTQIKNSGPTQGLQTDVPSNFKANQMTYNDPSTDKHFTDTISWTLPTKICQFDKALVTWTIANIAGNGMQSNDTTGLWQNGGQIAGSSHNIAMAKGQRKTFTQVLNPAQIGVGHVTLVAQDESAVMDFKVEITGCCIDPSVGPK